MPNLAITDWLPSSLPGEWIAENYRIWQMKLLDARDFGNFCSKRGLSSFSKNQVTFLWQLGFLKADLIKCEEELTEDTLYEGLVACGMSRDGYYLYSDERKLHQLPKGWTEAENTILPLRQDITLLFHPFRYYVLYHIHDELGFLRISRMQVFRQSSAAKNLELILTLFNEKFSSDGFVPTINTWNDIASLCVVTEPCVYQRIFGTIKYDVSEVSDLNNGVKEIKNHITDYWNGNVKKLYMSIGDSHIEEIRKEMDLDVNRLDRNEWVHTLLCLSRGQRRLDLEGNLGGALLLRTMIEVMRRALEAAFDREFPEEDELGFERGGEIKKELYGSSRILDDQNAGAVFLRRHGLSYKSRIHFYVEGNTEYGAINYFFKTMGIYIPVANLRGLIKMKSKDRNQMVTFFKDSLLEDIKANIYSIVVIDGDLSDNVRIIKNHARINQTAQNEGMFGRFFIAQPDFEYANFEGPELEEIIWAWVTEDTGESPTIEDRELFHAEVKDAKGSREFFEGVKRMMQRYPYLPSDKNEIWGEKLMDYALRNPIYQGRKRQIYEIVELALRWETIDEMETYEQSKKSYMIDEKTGDLISRLT